MIGALVWRDLARSFGSGAALPPLFFLLVAVLFPFAIGPDSGLLKAVGGGALWVAALLAAILPIDRLVAPDAEQGVLDQLAIRGMADEMVFIAKTLAHWLSFGPPLLLAALPASALLRLDATSLIRLELGLLIGTPALAALAMLAAVLTSGLRNAGTLGGLLILPLAIPILIFGAGALGEAGNALKLLAATSLFLLALTPFAGGAALRALRV